jgi:hypothetical protein
VNCNFAENLAEEDGGAMFVSNSIGISLDEIDFYANVVSRESSAMSVMYVSRCEMSKILFNRNNGTGKSTLSLLFSEVSIFESKFFNNTGTLASAIQIGDSAVIISKTGFSDLNPAPIFLLPRVNLTINYCYFAGEIQLSVIQGSIRLLHNKENAKFKSINPPELPELGEIASGNRTIFQLRKSNSQSKKRGGIRHKNRRRKRNADENGVDFRPILRRFEKNFDGSGSGVGISEILDLVVFIVAVVSFVLIVGVLFLRSRRRRHISTGNSLRIEFAGDFGVNEMQVISPDIRFDEVPEDLA